MSKEQNLNGFLELLKSSVQESGDGLSDEASSEKYNDISQEDLEAQLKNRFLSDSNKENDASVSEYQLDTDFLKELEDGISEEVVDDISDMAVAEASEYTAEELVEATAEETAEAITEEAVEEIVKEVVEDNLEEAVPESDSAVGVIVEAQNLSSGEEKLENEITENDLPWKTDVEEEDTIAETDLQNVSAVSLAESDADMEQDEKDQLDSIDQLLSSMSPISESEYAEYEEATERLQYDAEDIIFTEQEQVYADNSLDDLEDIPLEPEEEQPVHKTFLASIRETGIEFTAEEIYNSTVASSETNTDEEQPYNDVQMEIAEEDNESLDLSTINLMMQFCEKEEVERTIGDAKVDDFLKYENEYAQVSSKNSPEGGREYTDLTQKDSILSSYKGKHFRALLSFIGCSFIAALALLFELLPLFEIQLDGILNYEDYPFIYILVGFQFIIVSAAICYKQLWFGLQRAFSLTPNRHSVVFIMLSMTAIYNVMCLVLALISVELPATYNGIAAVLVAVMALSDYLSILMEMKAFEVYSSDGTKYTLTKEAVDGLIGSKMYEGGLSEEKNIYISQRIEFPNGFFRSVSASPRLNRALVWLMLPVAIVAMIASILTAILHADAYAAFASVMVCIYFILPIALILADVLPYAISALRLAKRGSAFAGVPSLEKHGDCDVAVFNDLHMFKKCKTEDVGFAVYDTGVGYLALGCLDALYSKIGGPLSGLQMNLPDVFKFNNVSIRRMARNGIEAVIDGKYVLIVGEHSFMQRYGLEFPPNEKENDRSTLCVSLNGKITAKLSVKYEVDPIFEMIVERLAKEGIACAIHTYDPLISGSVAASLRTLGNTPVSVIHKTVCDFAAESKKRYKSEADEVISVGSRLKLAEVVVWIKKLTKLKKVNTFIAIGFSSVGLLISALLVIFGGAAGVNQFYLLMFLALELIAMISAMLVLLPGKKYFTVDELYSELEKAHSLEAEKQQKNNKVKNKIKKEIQ